MQISCRISALPVSCQVSLGAALEAAEQDLCRTYIMNDAESHSSTTPSGCTCCGSQDEAQHWKLCLRKICSITQYHSSATPGAPAVGARPRRSPRISVSEISAVSLSKYHSCATPGTPAGRAGPRRSSGSWGGVPHQDGVEAPGDEGGQ